MSLNDLDPDVKASPLSPSEGSDARKRRGPAARKNRRMRLPKWFFQDAPAYFRQLTFRPVRSQEEFLAASHVVYQEYLKQGFIPPNKEELHFSLHQMLPTTVTFVALYQDREVLATVTLAEDSPLGLPMDKAYELELNKLRQYGHHLAEITRLAVNNERLSTFMTSRWERLLLLFHLFKAMFGYVRSKRILLPSSRSVDDFVACFHPGHDFLYEFIGFMPLGEEKPYESVQGSPAVARYLHLANQEVKALIDSQYQHLMFYLEDKPTRHPRFRLSAKNLKALLTEKPDLLASLTPDEVHILKRLYPDLEV